MFRKNKYTEYSNLALCYALMLLKIPVIISILVSCLFIIDLILTINFQLVFCILHQYL